MTVRKTQPDELDSVMEIYAYAREFMSATGNPKQWGAIGWPPRELIEQDIQAGRSYVIENGGSLQGVFFFLCGERVDPCYAYIEDGAWQGSDTYGVIHRIASAEGAHGVLAAAVAWAHEQVEWLRIDTHTDNRVMQDALKKIGFERSGIIYVEEDDDPRIAFEMKRPA